MCVRAEACISKQKKRSRRRESARGGLSKKVPSMAQKKAYSRPPTSTLQIIMHWKKGGHKGRGFTIAVYLCRLLLMLSSPLFLSLFQAANGEKGARRSLVVLYTHTLFLLPQSQLSSMFLSSFFLDRD